MEEVGWLRALTQSLSLGLVEEGESQKDATTYPGLQSPLASGRGAQGQFWLGATGDGGRGGKQLDSRTRFPLKYW